MCENLYDKTYFELWAKNLLEMSFPFMFSNLKKAEKPDLQQDDLWGIEVTRIGYQQEQRITNIWNNNAGMPKQQIKSKDLTILDQVNPTYNQSNELISIDPSNEWREGEIDINGALTKKLKRLNDADFNSNFKYNGLFVFYEDCSHQHSIQDLITSFNAIQLTHDKKFDFLFVWDSFRLHMYYNSQFFSDDQLSLLKSQTLIYAEGKHVKS